MEGKDCIGLYVGGEYARTGSDYYKQKEVDVMTLQENDIIIAASDGVLDYMGAKLSDTEWDKERALVNMLMKQEPLKMIASHIISKDNKNGGGDNLSLILIKAGGTDDE
jgi:serine/threonine protein phosphatase PrpC